MAKKSKEDTHEHAEETPASTAVAAAREPVSKQARAWENIKSIAMTVAVFLLLRAFLIEAYRIPSGSMVPTLLIGDWLFVNKLRYGPHVPFTNWNLPGYAEPKVGDVAVFRSPLQQDLDPRRESQTPTLVKRIQGGPGDTLHMRNGLLYRNGEPRPLAFKTDTGYADTREVSPLFVWLDNAGLRNTRFGPPPARADHDNWGPVVVPPAYFFMMGDARYDSKDSRYWGLVPRKNFRGRPLFIYYTYNANDSDRLWPAITDIRWGRIGTIIR